MNLLSHSVLAVGLPMAEEGGHTAPVVAPDMGAGGVFDLLWLVIALPALGAVLLLGVAPFLPPALRATADRHGHLLGTAMAALSFVLSVVLFVALLGHLRIREEVSTPQILYLEYFYFVAYLMVLSVSVIVFVAALPGPHARVITDRDVLLPKLLYWPISMICYFAVTIWVFY